MRFLELSRVGIVLAVLSVVAGTSRAVAGTAREREDVLTQMNARVRFEKRATIVPRLQCIESRCPHSQPYWAVVMEPDHRDSSKAIFEFNQPFAVGSHRAPESVEVAGVVLRPGLHVAVTALAHPISQYLVIFTEIQNIQPLERGELEDLASAAPTLPVSDEWSCQGPQARGYQLLAQVSPTRAQQSLSRYHMHVFARKMDSGNRLYEVARIQRIRSGIQGPLLVYEGETSETSAELSIGRDQGSQQFPASLRLSHREPDAVGPDGVGRETRDESTPFRCVRTKTP